MLIKMFTYQFFKLYVTFISLSIYVKLFIIYCFSNFLVLYITIWYTYNTHFSTDLHGYLQSVCFFFFLIYFLHVWEIHTFQNTWNNKNKFLVTTLRISTEMLYMTLRKMSVQDLCRPIMAPLKKFTCGTLPNPIKHKFI